MLMLPGDTHHLRNLLFCNLKIEHATDTLAFGVNLQHHLGRARALHAKYRLENIDNKLHRSEIIINQHHAIQRRLLDLRASFLNSQIVAAALFVFVSMVTHGRIGDIRSIYVMSIAAAPPGHIHGRLYIDPWSSRYIIVKYSNFSPLWLVAVTLQPVSSVRCVNNVCSYTGQLSGT